MENWAETLALVTGALGLREILAYLFQRKKIRAEGSKAEEEIGSIIIENEIKMADGWRENYKILSENHKELNAEHKKIQDQIIEIRRLYWELEERAKNLTLEIDKKDARILVLEDRIKKVEQNGHNK